MDLAEYIKQKTAQDIYKEAASKEYRRSSVKDRLEKIQNDRRHTRDRLLSSIRNITHLSPITPTPNPSRDQSKVSKKVANNNMREKLAKWRAEKEKRKLEEKKKIRPVFKVSHVPDRIELPPPPPHVKSKFAPVDHVFVAPKNIKPIEITKASSSLKKPVERKPPGRVEKNDNKKKMPKTLSSLSKPVERNLPSRYERNDNKKKMLQVNSNCLTEKIVPLAGQPSYQKSNITKSKIGKENKAKAIAPKTLQTANQNKDTAIKKNVFSKVIVSASSNNNKKKLISDVKGMKGGTSTSKVVPRQDQANKHLKQSTNQIVMCESSTDDEGSELELLEHKKRSSMETDEKQKQNMDKTSKRHQSSSVSGSDKEIDLTSSPKKAALSHMERKNRILRCISGADDEGSTIVEPLKRKSVGKAGQKQNGTKEVERLIPSGVEVTDEEIDLTSRTSDEAATSDTERTKVTIYMSTTEDNDSTSLGPQKRKSMEKMEQQGKEIKSKIVRFGSQDSVGSDDVFITPVKIKNHAGVLRIDNGVNISLSRPASTKKYKTTPYKSLHENEIFYSDEEICLKSPAVRKSLTSLKTPDKRSTPGISDFCVSTSDSGGSFQCVTMRRGTRSLFMSTSDSGTPGSIGGLKSKSRTSVNSQGSLVNAVDSISKEQRIAAPDTRGRSSLVNVDVEDDVVDLKASKPNGLSESSGTRKSLETASKRRRISSVKSASDVLDSKTSISNEISTRKSLTVPLAKSETSSVQKVAPSDLDTSNLKSNEVSESSSTRKSLKTPTKKRRTSFVKRAASSNSDILDSQTPKSSEIFDSPSITMSLRTRLKKRGNSSSQDVTPSDTLVSKDSESNEVSGSLATRRSRKSSTKNRKSSSVKSASKISESPANRKSLIRLLQKYGQSTSPTEIDASDSDGSQTKVKSVTTTPDVKSSRLSSSNIETPEQKRSAGSSVYVSPFVTISRGKNSARKEYHVRSSTGGTLPGAEATTSPKAGAQYFDDLLNNEIERIEVICHEWNEYKDTGIPEEAQNMIDAAVGQSKLLIAKKFNQFRRLIEQCRSGGEERTVTCQDLHGFWDMVFLQVQDVDKRFDNLNKLKENNWQEVITEKKVVRAKRQRKTKTQASSKIKEMIDAARKKKAQELHGKPMNDLPIILAEGIKVDQSEPVLPSPRPSPRNSLTKPNSGVGRSLRASLLTNQLQQKRRNSSPGLAMMSVSQLIKANDGLTPCKSILKNAQQSKSEKRITKTVLFKEDLEEERRFEHD